MSAAELDSLKHAETPEGVDLALRPAGPVVRSFAWLIDGLIRLVFYFALALTLPQFGEFGLGVGMIILFVVEWFYPVVFEMAMRGATPGKALFGIRVILDDGLPLTWYASMTRNVLRTVDFLPVFYATGLVTMLFNNEFKRLGDLAAGTVVVYGASIDDKRPLPNVAPEPLPNALELAEQRAIMDFGRRLAGFSKARAEELAGLLQPWLGANANPGKLSALAMGIIGRSKKESE